MDINQNKRLAPLVAFTAALFIYALATALRSTPIVTAPSFWGEEGTYFAFAHGHGWIEALLQGRTGYLSLWANIACTVAAKLVPLEFAPFVTMLFAFAVQLVPPVILLTSRAELWDSPAKKLFGLLFLLFAPASFEVWLNTINSQFYFALIALFVLLEPDDLSPARKKVFRGLLVIAGLTGPVTGILFPLFFWSWLRGKSRERAVQVGILLGCIAVQAGYIFFIKQDGQTDRSFAANAFVYVSILWTRLAFVFTGRMNSLVWTDRLERIFYHPENPRIAGLPWSLLLVEAIFLAHVIAGLPTKLRVNLVGAFLLLVVIGTAFSVHNKLAYIYPLAGTRYFFVPSVLLLIMTFAATDFQGRKARSVLVGISLLLCASGLYFGIGEYQKMEFRYRDSYPAWRQEVALWRRDNRYQLRIWPAGWTMELGSDRLR